MNKIRKAIAQIPAQRKKKADGFIIFTVLVLCVFGVLMIWSASMYNARISADHNFDEFYYARKQLKFIAAGIVIMTVMSVIRLDMIKSLSPVIMLIMLIMLIATISKSDEDAVGGAIRYIVIAGTPVQPSEFTKIAVLMFMSYLCELFQKEMKTFKVFCVIMFFTALTSYIIYKQPALSTAIIIAVLYLAMYFVAGGNFTFLCGGAVLAISAVYLFIAKNGWRMDRIEAWLDPWSDFRGTGWQPANSLMALGSGGLFGKGIGKGIAKLGFLPELQNDYIFSVVGEELGFIGCMALIAVYIFLILRLFMLGMNAKDMFSRVFCSGAAILFAVQVFFNIAVCTNLIPSTGVVLPFVSSGGSSMISYMTVVGMVLNISRNNPLGGLTLRKKAAPSATK